jgi:MOSC domain-containing protein YiiM
MAGQALLPAMVEAATMATLRRISVVSVNLAQARALTIGDRQVLSAIDKRPAVGPVTLHATGLEGDEQADLSVHGGLSKAVYAYPLEHYPFWQTVRAQARAAPWDEALAPGTMGENLTLSGLLETELWIGDLLRLPGCVLAVSEPRQPCFKFNAVMGFAQAGKLMAQSGYCGCYLTVLEPGVVTARDAVELIAGPREVSLRELFRARARP